MAAITKEYEREAQIRIRIERDKRPDAHVRPTLSLIQSQIDQLYEASAPKRPLPPIAEEDESLISKSRWTIHQQMERILNATFLSLLSPIDEDIVDMDDADEIGFIDPSSTELNSDLESVSANSDDEYELVQAEPTEENSSLLQSIFSHVRPHLEASQRLLRSYTF
jgi:hypothetical protein